MKLKNTIAPAVFYSSVFLVVGIGIILFAIRIIMSGEAKLSTLSFVIMFVGIIIVVISLLSIKSTLKKVKVTDDLKQTGYKCPGVIIEIVPDYSMAIDGNHPFIARCHVMDSVTGEIMVLKSDPYFNNLSKLMYKEVDVYIDDLKKGRYFIDMDKLISENPGLVSEIASYDYTPY